jgi:FixJ family two-component response regulator
MSNTHPKINSSPLDTYPPARDMPIKVTPAPLQGLTRRQYQVMDLVLSGHPSKNIAVDLGISQRTVENHRAAIMRRTGATSLPALARLAIGADVVGDCANRILVGDF